MVSLDSLVPTRGSLDFGCMALSVSSLCVCVCVSVQGKYLSTIQQAGGWGYLQRVLRACKKVATKHDVRIAIATYYICPGFMPALLPS